MPMPKTRLDAARCDGNRITMQLSDHQHILYLQGPFNITYVAVIVKEEDVFVCSML